MQCLGEVARVVQAGGADVQPAGSPKARRALPGSRTTAVTASPRASTPRTISLPRRPVAPITAVLIVSLPVEPGQFEDVRSTMMARAWPAALVRQDASRCLVLCHSPKGCPTTPPSNADRHHPTRSHRGLMPVKWTDRPDLRASNGPDRRDRSSTDRWVRVRVAKAARSRTVTSTGPEAPTRWNPSLQPEGQVCVLTPEPLSRPR